MSILEKSNTSDLSSENHSSPVNFYFNCKESHHKMAFNLSRTSSHSSKNSLELFLTWKDQIYDSRIYFPGEVINLEGEQNDFHLPIFFKINNKIFYDEDGVTFLINKNAKGTLRKDSNDPIALEKILKTTGLPNHKYFPLKLKQNESLVLDLGLNLQVHARYLSRPRQLTKSFLKKTEQSFKQALLESFFIHSIFLFINLFFISNTPKIPEEIKKYRNARVIIEPPAPLQNQNPIDKLKTEPKQIQSALVRPRNEKKIAKTERRQVLHMIKARSPHRLSKNIKPTPITIKSSPTPPITAIRSSNPKSSQPIVKSKKPGSLKDSQPKAYESLERILASTSNPKNISLGNLNLKQEKSSSVSTTQIINNLSLNQNHSKNLITNIKSNSLPALNTQLNYDVQNLKSGSGHRQVEGSVVGDPKLSFSGRKEGLTTQQVLAVVNQSLGKIQQCYELALLNQPQMMGRMEFIWEIFPSGKVKWIQLKRTDISQSGSLNLCIQNIFKGMSFPKAKNGEPTLATIGFPFGRI
ncbi:MAG: AgmX/PglI C-terminal domain-containing protein [Bdellovibrionales bacterium]|nr:AgmX/PglI C-terminal domain-containing protein [Bdellovibrionales bacterium]